MSHECHAQYPRVNWLRARSVKFLQLLAVPASNELLDLAGRLGGKLGHRISPVTPVHHPVHCAPADEHRPAAVKYAETDLRELTPTWPSGSRELYVLETNRDILPCSDGVFAMMKAAVLFCSNRPRSDLNILRSMTFLWKRGDAR
jgi:hypothetical protein